MVVQRCLKKDALADACSLLRELEVTDLHHHRDSLEDKYYIERLLEEQLKLELEQTKKYV